MTKSQSRITLNPSQDIPFNKLVLSQANVRRVKAGISVEELAEDIARRGLLQSLSVRPVRDADGAETGMYEIPAGGRRYRALELLVKQKRMSKTQPVPCVVRTEGLAEEDSLAENVQRVALHPLDQYRAFQALREQGIAEDEIAARFFVTPAVVKQRLKLAAVSPKLLDLYAADAMTLEQLMAFTVTGDHVRQEQVWEALTRSHNTGAYFIRRQLTQGAVNASDRRARFIGIEAYEAAGGTVTRDLFEDDEGGWLQDVALLDRLVNEKLASIADVLRAEGWKWIEAAVDFPYGYTRGMRRLEGEAQPLTGEQQANRDMLQAELDRLEQDYAEADELPDEVDARLGEIETALEALDDRPIAFDASEIARAGSLVRIDAGGIPRIERGFVRAEDDVHAHDDAAEPVPVEDGTVDDAGGTVVTIGGRSPDNQDEAEDDRVKPLPDRLVTELTAWRTLALRNALAGDSDTAFLAVLHAFCLDLFYHRGTETCLEVTLTDRVLGGQPGTLADSVPAKAIEARHEEWLGRLPDEPSGLWDVLRGFDGDTRAALFAHCAALSVNAVREPWNRKPGRDRHADQLAAMVGLDPVASGWTTTVDNYLGRVTKARIVAAVREGKGEEAARHIEPLKKPDMAREAERLLAESGWVPEPVRNAATEVNADAEPLDEQGTALSEDDVALAAE